MENLANLMVYIQMIIQHALVYLGELSLLLFILLIVNLATRGLLGLLGIHPRKLFGLQGIVFAPFIHANFNHFFFNLIPLLILSVMLMVYGYEFYWQISWVLIVVSGSLIWLFARPGIHIGASALVTAYWGFLVTDALLNTNSILNLAIGFICIYYFIGIFIGIFPSEDRVSWEGHLMGLITGMGIYLLGHYLPFFHQVIFERPYWIKAPDVLMTASEALAN